jgi:threonine dehydratase
VDVAHSRQNPRLSFGEVDVALSVETRGPVHSAVLIDALRGSGYTVTLLSGSL